jgi:transposase
MIATVKVDKVKVDTQRVGALPVISEFCNRLHLADLVNTHVPWKGEVPLGDIVEIMVANRILEPKPMYKLGSWATKATLANFYKLNEEKLHDDCIGRALERLAEHGTSVQAALVLRAIERFGLKVNQIHYDMSTIELYGAYKDYEEEGVTDPTRPRPTYGHTKSGRKDLKQIQFGINVAQDGAVPISHRIFDGNTPEAPTHLQNLKDLARLLPKGDLLYLGDSKLDSQENFLAIVARQGKFLSGGTFSESLQGVYLSVRNRLQPLDYYPQSQAKRPPEKRDKYQGVEVPQEFHGLVEKRPLCCKYRLLFIWSEAKARQEAMTRERHVAKITAVFTQTAKNLNKYKLKTQEDVVRRLEAARSRYTEGQLFQYEVSEDSKGQLKLAWRLDSKAVTRWQALEGVFLLKTNLSVKTHTLVEVLRTYKGQIQVERRIGNLKGPLAVTPMYLKKPKRMAGLMYILMWALMIMSLMERQVRKQLKGEPMYGLYPENRPSKAPTGVRLIEAFEYLCIVLMQEQGKTIRYLGELDATQKQILSLLDMAPGQMKTFKTRCGT